MPRSFWKGSLGFGLVEIPVSLYSAAEPQETPLTLLDRQDFSPVGYRRYNKHTGEEVPWERIVRGYEHDDEYVVLSDDDLVRANVEASHRIEIMTFVERDAIHPVYYETPYFVVPTQKTSKSYALLREALDRSGRVGVARVVLRVRQHLAAVTVRDDALMLDVLRFEHELRPARGLEFPPREARRSGVASQELKMALQLIDGMTGEWKPSQYRDEYHDDLLALVEQRVREGKTHAIETSERKPRPKRVSEVVDLLPLLKQSLEKRLGARARPRKSAATTQPRRRKRTA